MLRAMKPGTSIVFDETWQRRHSLLAVSTGFTAGSWGRV